MNGRWKTTLILLGSLAAILLVMQLVLGLIIVGKPTQVEKWVKIHQHSGYLTVPLALLYIVGSLATVWSIPKRPRG